MTCFHWLDGLRSAYNKSPSDNYEDMMGMANDLFTRRHLGGIIFICLQMIIGLTGNITVLYIYVIKFKSSNYRTYTTWLAAIDLANCCLGMPFLILYHTNYLKFPNEFICKAGRFILVFTANASAFLLVVIAVDRYRHVCKPMDWQISKKWTTVNCITAVICAFGISWPAFQLFGNHSVTSLPFNMEGTRCWVDDRYNGTRYLSYFYIGLSSLSLTITLVLFIMYGLILQYIYMHKNCFRSRTNKSTREYIAGKTALTKRTTVILLSVTFAYVLSSIPHNVFVVVLLTKEDLHCYMTYFEGMILYTLVWSILLNNSINPFIYGFSDRRFRQEVKDSVLCYNCFGSRTYPKSGHRRSFWSDVVLVRKFTNVTNS